MSKITNDGPGLAQDVFSCTRMTAVNVKGLIYERM